MGLRAVKSTARHKALMTTLLCSAATVSMAEIGYVTDSLRLGVHEAQDTSDQAFTYLESGDRVEILERTPFYAKVTIPDGRNGWVRVTYLVDEEPAKRRVARLERERYPGHRPGRSEVRSYGTRIEAQWPGRTGGIERSPDSLGAGRASTIAQSAGRG